MRITGWHVDGYGVLADLRVSDLPEGLTVVVGANEAGKSTLLDFVRGVLFGFPDRRSRLPYREPLRGGRHGGRLELLDDSGRAWSLSRHVGARDVLLDGPHGAAGGEEALRHLLGGADAGLFRSVFAFGLDELSSLATLDSDEVRDAVFSAGVLGAGRSAQRAAKSLRQRREVLARQRRADAVCNRLQAELAGLDEALREARRASLAHPASRAEQERLAGAVSAARRDAELLRDRLLELDRLAAAWPVRCRLVAAGEELAAIGPLGERGETLLSHRQLVLELAAERAGHIERLRRRSELSSQLAGIERERGELLAELAPGFSTSGPPPGEPDAGLVAEVEELAGRRREAQASLVAARRELGRAEDEHRAALAERDAGSDAPGTPAPPRPLAVLDELEVTVDHLRAELAERDRLRSERTTAGQALELARLAAGNGTRARPVSAALAGLAAVFVLVAGVAAWRHEDPVAAVALLAAVALTAGALALRAGPRSPARRPAASASSASSASPASPGDGGGGLERLEEAVRRLARRLELASEPTLADVAACAARLANERSRRVRCDFLAAAAERAARARDSACVRVGACEEELLGIDRRVVELCERVGVVATLGAEGLARVLGGLAGLAKLDAAARRVGAPLARLVSETTEFERRLAALDAAVPAGSVELSEDPVVAIASLEAELQELAGRAGAAAQLARACEECEEQLASQLGGGESGRRLRAALEGGDVIVWTQQRAGIAAELEEATARHERAVAAHRDAERANADLEAAGTVAGLELARDTTSTALDAALEDWLVLGLAEGLLDKTLARYERERQPLVVARAGALFAGVTGGRYPVLLAREDESGRSHAIDAVTPTGERVDCGSLSRGTAEQLYLCLRLAYASTFAEQATALPLVLDDVLVNFDPARARSMAGAIVETAASHQVLAFTCHPHVAELLCSAAGGARVVELDAGPAPAKDLTGAEPAVHYPPARPATRGSPEEAPEETVEPLTA